MDNMRRQRLNQFCAFVHASLLFWSNAITQTASANHPFLQPQSSYAFYYKCGDTESNCKFSEDAHMIMKLYRHKFIRSSTFEMGLSLYIGRMRKITLPCQALTNFDCTKEWPNQRFLFALFKHSDFKHVSTERYKFIALEKRHDGKWREIASTYSNGIVSFSPWSHGPRFLCIDTIDGALSVDLSTYERHLYGPNGCGEATPEDLKYFFRN
jgi:hypothetical protein